MPALGDGGGEVNSEVEEALRGKLILLVIVLVIFHVVAFVSLQLAWL